MDDFLQKQKAELDNYEALTRQQLETSMSNFKQKVENWHKQRKALSKCKEILMKNIV